jgi:hypothetical protein
MQPFEYRIREPIPAPVASGVIERDQLFGFSHREHFQQHRVEHTEDGCVRPDTEREREHGHGGEAGVFPQLAEGEFEIVHSGNGQ